MYQNITFSSDCASKLITEYALPPAAGSKTKVKEESAQHLIDRKKIIILTRAHTLTTT